QIAHRVPQSPARRLPVVPRPAQVRLGSPLRLRHGHRALRRLDLRPRACPRNHPLRPDTEPYLPVVQVKPGALSAREPKRTLPPAAGAGLRTSLSATRCTRYLSYVFATSTTHSRHTTAVFICKNLHNCSPLPKTGACYQQLTAFTNGSPSA